MDHFSVALSLLPKQSQSTSKLLSKVTMPAGAFTDLDSGPTRRSPRLKNIQKIYDEDSDWDSYAFKPVKTEVVDLEEIASPSVSDLASVSGKDCDQDFDSVSLKDLRARCRAKKRKDSTIMSGEPSIQTGKIIEEFDLNKPLIALKHKRHKGSRTKANGMMNILISSPCAAKVEDTKSKREEAPSPTQSFLLDATVHDSATEKLERSATDLEQSTIVIGCTKDIVGEDICCVGLENKAGDLASCGNPDVLCKTKADDIEIGTSTYPEKSCSQHSSFELPQEKIEK